MKKLLVLALVVSAMSFGCSKKEEAPTTEAAPAATTEAAPEVAPEVAPEAAPTMEAAPATEAAPAN